MLLDAEIDIAELSRPRVVRDQVSEAVASDADTAALRRGARAASGHDRALSDDGDLPSGDSLAAELTRFLRQHDREQDDDGPRGQ